VCLCPAAAEPRSTLAALGVPRVAEQPITYRHAPFAVQSLGEPRHGIEAYRCLRRTLSRSGWLVMIGDSNTRNLFNALVRTVFPAREFGNVDFRHSGIVDPRLPWSPRPGKTLQRTRHANNTRYEGWTDIDVIGTYGAEADAGAGMDPARPGLRLSLRFISSDDKFDRLFANGTLSPVNVEFYNGGGGLDPVAAEAAFRDSLAPPGRRWATEKNGSERPDLVSPHTGMWHWENMPEEPVAWERRFRQFALRRLTVMGTMYKGPVLWRTINLPRTPWLARNYTRMRVSARRVIIANEFHARRVADHYMVLDTTKLALDMWSRYQDAIHVGGSIQTVIVQQILTMLCGTGGGGA
jgi:hypothetical protein